MSAHDAESNVDRVLADAEDVLYDAISAYAAARRAQQASTFEADRQEHMASCPDCGLPEVFPDALLSGYVLVTMETMLEEVDGESPTITGVHASRGLSYPTRVGLLNIALDD